MIPTSERIFFCELGLRPKTQVEIRMVVTTRGIKKYFGNIIYPEYTAFNGATEDFDHLLPCVESCVLQALESKPSQK